VAYKGLLSRRADLVALLGALALPLLAFPILARPELGIALVVGVPALLLAAKSVVFPLALSGVPALVVGFLGQNPFPPGFVFFFITGWLLLGLALAIAREPSLPAVLRSARAPILITLVLSLLLLTRLQPGTYPMEKIQLFLASAPLVLVAGLLVARRSDLFRLYLVVWLLVAIAHGLLLLKGLVGGEVYDYSSDRVTTSEETNPINAGRQAAYGILIATFFVLTARSAAERVLGFVGLPVLAIALLASGSRGPVLALALASVLLIVLMPGSREKRKRLLSMVAAAAATFVLVPSVVPGDAIERATSILTGSDAGLSSNGRTELWGKAWEMFVEHPLVGAGTGAFARVDPVQLYPHNILLEAAGELGIVGAAAVLALLATGIAAATRTYREGRGAVRAQMALLVAMLTAAILNAMLSDGLEDANRVWLIVGLVYGLGARASEGALAEEPSAPKQQLPHPPLRQRVRPAGAHAFPR
jgi:O-antigen ligase